MCDCSTRNTINILNLGDCLTSVKEQCKSTTLLDLPQKKTKFNHVRQSFQWRRLIVEDLYACSKRTIFNSISYYKPALNFPETHLIIVTREGETLKVVVVDLLTRERR